MISFNIFQTARKLFRPTSSSLFIFTTILHSSTIASPVFYPSTSTSTSTIFTTPSLPSTTPTTTTASTTPNSPPSAVSFAPTPSGKHHDATSVKSKTEAFCNQYGDWTIYDLDNPTGHLINGDSQDANSNHGSTNNEKRYNMTIEMLFDGCWVQGATVMHPLPKTPEFNCTGLLYTTYGSCE